MKKKVLVIESDDSKYTSLYEHLAELEYSGDDIYRYKSVIESLSVTAKDLGIIFTEFNQASIVSLQGLRELQNSFENIPVIALSDKYDNDASINAIRNGAQDFLALNSLDAPQLERAISCAVERKTLLLKSENTSAEYEKLFDNGPIPMWIIDGKTMKFLVVNDATIEKYGYSKEEFKQMSARDIRPEEDIAAIIKFHNQKKPEYYDAGYWRHKKKNGEIFYVHVYSHVISYHDIDARLSVIVDVNEKFLADKHNKELMALTKEQKEELDNILFSISDAIWSRRSDTMELTYANNAYYKLYGYSPGEDILDKKLDVESIHPADRAAFSLAMHEVQTMGKTELVYRYIHKNGSIKVLKAAATFKKGVDGKPDMIAGITVDITKEKEFYDTVRNNEQKLRATINNTKDLIWSVNAKLELIFCNKPYQDFFYKLTGIVLDEGDYVLGSWHNEAFISKRKKDYERAFNGESFSTVIEEHLNGDTLYFEISSNPIIDVDGKIIGINCISRDITEQKMQLIKIQQQNERLKEIAWIQSHKVRAPVASILGLAALFDASALGNEHNQEILEQLKIATLDLDNISKEIVKKTIDVDHTSLYPDLINQY